MKPLISSIINTFISEEVISLITHILLKDNTKESHDLILEYINILDQFPLPLLKKEELQHIRDFIKNWSPLYEQRYEYLKNTPLFRYLKVEHDSDITILKNRFHFYYDQLHIASQYYKALEAYEELVDPTKLDPRNITRFFYKFREIVKDIYSSLPESPIVDLSDYLILNESKVHDTASELLKFLKKSYSYFKTGYKFLDENVGGIEASTVHIIAGPSNHGKSLFMLNILYWISESLSQKEDFEVSNKAIVWITLEDSIYRLIRRLISIFGNVHSGSVRSYYAELSSKISSNLISEDTAKQIITNLIREHILGERRFTDEEGKIHIVKKRVPHIVLKHSEEYSLSTHDIKRFLQHLQLQGYEPIALFLDYLDLVLPSDSSSNISEYQSQGTVVQELRAIANQFGIPVITATQNQRIAEDPSIVLSNRLIGDSYKKVRYADYIYMIRQNHTLDLSDPKVVEKVGSSDELDDAIRECITVMELAITKAKDAPRDITDYLLFNTYNLRMYSNINELIKDYHEVKYLDTTNIQAELMNNLVMDEQNFLL